jgi:hypothetical protein
VFSEIDPRSMVTDKRTVSASLAKRFYSMCSSNRVREPVGSCFATRFIVH